MGKINWLTEKFNLWMEKTRRRIKQAKKIDLFIYVFLPVVFTMIPFFHLFDVFTFDKNIAWLYGFLILLIVTYMKLTIDYMNDIEIKDAKGGICFFIWLAILIFLAVFGFVYAIIMTVDFIVTLIGAIYVLVMSVIIFKKIVDSYEGLNINFLLLAITIVALLDNGEMLIFGTYNLLKESVGVESWYGWIISGIEHGAIVMYKVNFSDVSHVTKEEQVIQYCFGRFLNTSILTTLLSYVYYNKK